MALIKCPECGKDVSSEAASCPYCGYPIKNDVDEQEVDIEPTPTYYTGSSAPKKQKRNVGCFGAGLRVAAFIVGIILLLGVCARSSNKEENYNTEFNAKYMAVECVKKKLKSPSTAKFCDWNVMQAKNLEGDKWFVTGIVDAQNSFGAMLRKSWAVTLTLTKTGCKDYEVLLFD